MRFRPGRVVSTPGAIDFLERTGVSPLFLLQRHLNGDWGDLCDEDRNENEVSVDLGFRILSSYKIGDGRVWIITEATREYTTILLPDEY
ncbi:MAG: hypothetical protein PHQ43_11585 [Dehalococcoidales bacterium]|nr:hypothetical protein [Dehalococcoidales bacterium]